MKTLIIVTLSFLTASLAFGQEQTQKLSIGKILPKQEEGSNKRPPPTIKPNKISRKPFPAHWGKPPALQTRDIRPLPFGFGMGSSTLAHWIAENVKSDIEDGGKSHRPPKRPKRPEPSEEVKVKLAAVQLAKNELDISRRILVRSIKDKSKEDVAELIKQFKNSQKEKHQQLKAAQKELAEEVRNKIQTKDRRE
jgi:hypothetical protein